MLAEENARLKETVQELKDEINRLKGEQGKPNIREQKKDDDDDDSTNPDHSSEKDRRRYAAIEVQKLSYGGQQYISRLLGCDEKTIPQGLQDLANEEELKKSG